MLCVGCLPFLYVDLSKIDDPNIIFSDNEKALEFKRSMFRNKEYQALVKKEMPRFLARGFMDV
jgi:hypothetical protein